MYAYLLVHKGIRSVFAGKSNLFSADKTSIEDNRTV